MTTHDPISLRRPIAELERWAAEMVFWFKPQSLPLPVITIQGGHRLALGWFAWSRWETRDAAILDEINFVPEYLNRDVFDIAETLLHELVHLANYTARIRDCTSNQYHNRHFRDRAAGVGLACERMSPYGWAKTSLTPALRERVAALQPDANAFDLFRLPPAPRRRSGAAVLGADGGGGVGVQVQKRKLSKWSCFGKCASAWVASGTELYAECLACGSRFRRTESID
jgi:hypothetical protein